MVFKNFNISIVIQVVLIGIICFLFSWSIYQEHLTVAKFTLGSIFILQLIFLIDYIKTSNKRLTRFMEWVKNEGISERFTSIESNSTTEELKQKFNEIIQILADSKADKESEYYYFQQALGIIGTGIISIHDEKIEIFNQAASELLHCESFNSIGKLKLKYPFFTNFILKLKNNEQKRIKLNINNSPLNLTAKCVIFKLKNKPIRLISFQDISNELAYEELEAWQKLIKVLRHEIINSVTPVKSLTTTIIKIFSDKGKSKKLDMLKQENIDNALDGLKAIDKRNQGMLKFIESYRSLSNIPKPVLESIKMNDFLEHIKILMSEELNKNSTKIKVDIKPEDLVLQGDEKLVSQVLINLIRNAIESMIGKGKKEIEIDACQMNNKTVISISDKGSGIETNDLENIFVPFYTTKKNGSGIGLSLCMQIMHLHNGQIYVESTKERGSTFSLEF